MSPESLLETLSRLTLLFSAAVLLIQLLRPLLLRALGAQATYLAWLTVPLLLASPWLPLPAKPLLTPDAAPVRLVALVDQTLPAMQPAQIAPASGAAAWLLTWVAGAVLVAAGLVVLQRRYLARLRRDTNGHWLAPAGASPAVVGLWPQRLVLPLDFEQRFDAPARRLVLAHEAVHARRHDNAWNLLGAAMLCLQWFNPLAWWAWRGLRDDQELACDAAVLAAETGPAPLAAYAQAMLAAHPGGLQPALASGWATRHPLVQRMRMLARHRAASRWQRMGSLLLVLGIGGGAAVLARAAQGPQAGGADKPSLTQGLIVELASQLGSQPWTYTKIALPGLEPNPMNTPRASMTKVMAPGMCLSLMLHEFAGGGVRPTAQLLDETCEHPLSDSRELSADGRTTQLHASAPQGPLQAQLSARWVAPDDPAVAAAGRIDLSGPLSPAQQKVLDRQREKMADVLREQQAQDRAWRAAREAQ
ncbi:MAG TPA: M56 family metallopeptidase [Roseateles sp.]